MQNVRQNFLEECQRRPEVSPASYSLCTHCPSISNPQFSPITLSPIQTLLFETRCTVYNQGLGPIGDLGLSGTWVYRGFCYREKGNRGLGPVGELK